MTRPAVIVGVGGTGQWVLTYLKKDLLEEGNGQLPSNVRFLSFDTMPQSEVTLGVSDPEEEVVNVGSVRLEKHEFVHLGGDAYGLGEAIFSDRQGQRFPQIRKWFQTEHWWQNLPQLSWILDEGAGRIRQMGRLAVFKDVMEKDAGSLIWRSTKKAIESVKSSASEDRRLEIILVGSFAGGTGSGMFLDMAIILRRMAAMVGDNRYILRGYFVLPSVFGAKQSDEMWARTFAAWRELNRFMVIDVNYPTRIDYTARDPSFQLMNEKRLFDACYLVGNRRGGKNIAQDAKSSIFPMLAESISAILDDQAGTTYTRFVSQNLAPVYAARGGTPMYSAVGSYTMKVPAYYKEQMSSHTFAVNLLTTLLGTRKEADLLVSSGDRIPRLAPPDVNLEKGAGTAGRKEADLFLKRDAISFHESGKEAEVARPTLFMAKMQRIVDEGGTKKDVLVQDHAEAVLKPRRRDVTDPSWLIPFTDLGEDPIYEATRRRVQNEINIDLERAFGPRREEKAPEVRDRLEKTDIKEFIFKHYGGETSEGQENYGDFGEVLKECRDFQLQLFRRMVRLWLLDTLTGQAEDPVTARGGKLGYAYDFLEGVIDNMEETRLFLEAVSTKREKEKPRLTLEGQTENSKKFMRENADKKFLWFFEHPDAKRSQQYFLFALQRLTDLRKEEIMHVFVRETILTMKDICSQTREEIKRWIWYLATGDDPLGLAGLYTTLKHGQAVVSGDHKIDEDIARAGFQMLIASEPETVDLSQLGRVLSWWRWGAEFVDNSLQIKARLQPEGREVSNLEAVWRAEGERRQSLAEANRRAFLKVAALHFQGNAQRTRIVDELVKGAEFADPKQLAEYLKGKAEPLFNGVPGEAQLARRSNIIRVGYNRGDAALQNYFAGPDGLQGELRAGEQLDPNKPNDDYLITVENSSNPYKLTMVRTDDLYPYDAFQDWEDCKRAYADFLFKRVDTHNDPRLLHNFASEINASYYEKRLAFSDSGSEFKPLHPKVVMLLEERERFELAMDCLLTGVIRFVPKEEKSWRVMNPYGTKVLDVWLAQPSTSAGEEQEAADLLFPALYNFLIIGHDCRPNFVHYVLKYDKITELVEEKKKKLWAGKDIEALEYHLELPNGLVNRLKVWGQNEVGDPSKVEFLDLARLIELLLKDRLERLQKPTVAVDEEATWAILDFGQENRSSSATRSQPATPSTIDPDIVDPDDGLQLTF